MSHEEVGRFVQDVQNNKELLEELSSGELGLDSLVDKARSLGYSFTADEAKEFAKSQQKSQEIGDEDLERVAGGSAPRDASEGTYIVVQPVVVTVALLILPS